MKIHTSFDTLAEFPSSMRTDIKRDYFLSRFKVLTEPRVRLLERKTGLSLPVIYYRPLQGDASVVVYSIVNVLPLSVSL